MHSSWSSVISARSEFGDGQAGGGADVLRGFAEDRGRADRDRLGVTEDVPCQDTF
jgi:hypothetical protein